MITKILIANRGEIALRIIRACREMNISTVAIYSKCDKDALHVKLADEAICVGDNKADESYLNVNNILQAAINTQAQAIHPGFGFLSENANFVRACQQLNIKFIGPTAKIIDKMGNKANARQTMIEANVPVVPGSDGLIKTSEAAYELAKKIGAPVIIKASAGGGGKGMRIAYHLDDVVEAYNNAKLEAKKVFNDDDMYLEKYVENPRHIEVQVIGDNYNNICHLFERECSIQRNNQKMIEEAPVENLKKDTKEKLYNAALAACKAINYVNAGTIEFIMDKDENFYFIEMNTRIQVEHPVSEMITGVDLIKEQIRIADNKELSFKQDDLKINGHAIEIRVNAENPKFNFAPSPGKINSLHFPGGNGIRIDSAIYQNYIIPPYYDSMIAKIIVHGKNRDEALEKGIHSLAEIDVEGVETNIDFQLDILLSNEFQNNEYTTSFVERFLKGGANV
ncbi:acetyl-CoA carboxylase biotin carboxylase subunit [Bacilli bacterium PM5-3]|nr:acetyl-CoA carboxylase biotin carboxylase subunit [Bacilli bacterium PM5-3]